MFVRRKRTGNPHFLETGPQDTPWDTRDVEQQHAAIAKMMEDNGTNLTANQSRMCLETKDPWLSKKAVELCKDPKTALELAAGDRKGLLVLEAVKRGDLDVQELYELVHGPTVDNELVHASYMRKLEELTGDRRQTNSELGHLLQLVETCARCALTVATAQPGLKGQTAAVKLAKKHRNFGYLCSLWVVDRKDLEPGLTAVLKRNKPTAKPTGTSKTSEETKDVDNRVQEDRNFKEEQAAHARLLLKAAAKEHDHAESEKAATKLLELGHSLFRTSFVQETLETRGLPEETYRTGLERLLTMRPTGDAWRRVCQNPDIPETLLEDLPSKIPEIVAHMLENESREIWQIVDSIGADFNGTIKELIDTAKAAVN